MELPLETKSLITNFLEMVRRDPQHHLSPADRYVIYESLSPSRLSYLMEKFDLGIYEFHQTLKNRFLNSNLGDYTLYWLAILTVKKDLSRKDQGEYLSGLGSRHLDTVDEILQVAKEVLLNQFDFIEAHHKLLSDFWFFTDSYVDYYSCLKYSAILALSVILYCDETGLGSPQGEYSYEDKLYDLMDYASEAVRAYTAIDKNLPGTVDRGKIRIPIDFDAQKRLEFWE